MQHLRGAARGAGADARAVRQGMDRRRTDQYVAHVFTREDRGDGDCGGADCFHVLERMDREIDFPGDQPGVQFLGPQRLAADLGQRAILDAVAAGGHRHQGDGTLVPAMRGAQPFAGFFGLRHGKRRAAGAKFEGLGGKAGHGGLC